MDNREGWFVIRCVFDRPECGVFVSGSQRADAPVSIGRFLRSDAPGGRFESASDRYDACRAAQFDKNTAFMISSTLCGQIERFKGITLGDLVRSVLPWPFHKDLSLTDTGPCKEGGLDLADLFAVHTDRHDLRAHSADHHGHRAGLLLQMDSLSGSSASIARVEAKKGGRYTMSRVDIGRLFGRGISFPPRVGPDGRVAWSEGEVNVRESIRIILMTEQNERLDCRISAGSSAHSCSNPIPSRRNT